MSLSQLKEKNRDFFDEITRKRIIETLELPCFVIAGPGTGKTELITQKTSFLINEKNFDSKDIILLTFTEKAAEEMKQRLESNYGIIEPRVYTFHSFALEVLQENNLLSSDFEIIDEFFMKYILREELITNFNKYVFKNFLRRDIFEKDPLKSNFIDNIHSLIVKFKEFGFTVEDLKNRDFENKEDFITIFEIYEREKLNKKYVDFPDLLLILKKELTENEKLRNKIKKDIKYVLVDEFQDTNKVQIEILDLITDNNVTVVGDPKQSIYKFRGANIDSFKEFENLKRKVKYFYLNKTHRFQNEQLLNFINLNIENESEKLFSIFSYPNSKKEENKDNKQVVNKSMNEDSKNLNIEDNFVNFISTDNEITTYELIKNIIYKNRKKKIGILCRNNKECIEISKELKKEFIDYNLDSQITLSSSPNIITLRNILYLVYEDGKKDIYLYDLLDKIIGNKEFLNNLVLNLVNRDLGYIKEIKWDDFSKYNLNEDLIKRLNNFVIKIEELKKERDKESIYSIATKIVYDFGILKDILLKKKSSELIKIKKFLEKIYDFEKIFGNNFSKFKDFIEYVIYNAKFDFNEDDEKVVENFTGEVNIDLLTIHKAKGREFDIVIIPFLNKNRFPSIFRRNNLDIFFDEDKKEFLKEEFNLFFVGITRAREKLYLTFVEKFLDNKYKSLPSDFILRFKDEFIRTTLKDEIERRGFLITKTEAKKIKEEELIKRDLEIVRELLLKQKFDDAVNVIKSLKREIENIGKSEIEEIREGENDERLKKDVKKIGLLNFIEENNKISSIEKYEKLNNRNYNNILFLSASKLETYIGCPLKYYYTYVLKLPTPETHYFRFGKVVHSVLQELVKEIYDKSKEVEYGMLVKKGFELLKENWKNEGFYGLPQIQVYYEKALGYIEDFVKIELERRDKREVIFTEKKINPELEEIENVKFTGVVDRLDKVGDKYEIIDYKTSKNSKNISEIREDIQLYLYKKGLESEGYNISKVALWYLDTNEFKEIRSEEILENKIKDKIIKAINGIRNNKFEPKESFCSSCPFKDICPYFKEKNFF